MKYLKLFFACMLMAVLSIGQVWATEVTWPGTTALPGTATGIAGDANVTIMTSATNSYTNPIRVYANNTITIAVASGYTIESVTYEASSTGNYVTYAQNATVTPSVTPSVSNKNVTWSFADATSTFTFKPSSQTRSNGITVVYSSTSGGSEPSLSVSPTVIDFGTVDQGASVEAQEVTVTYENLTGAVTYSGLSGAFAASGAIAASGSKITITPNTDNTGNFQQTLTVQSADDSKSAEVTVKMNVVAPFDGLKLTFDVSSNPGEWPTTNSTTTTNYTYTLNEVDYTFALNNVKCNSGYLMLTSVAKLGLPAISGYKLVKVEATNSSGCSTTTQVSVSSSDATKTDVTGGTAQTWGTTSTKYTYNLSGTEENTMYYLWIANKNCQLVELTLYYEEAEAATVATPVISGTESFLSSTAVSITCDTEGATIYYTTDGTDPKTSESKQSGTSFTLYNTATVRAIATKDAAWSAEATSKTFTKITPLTVAEAIAAIPNKNDVVDNQYVSGIVCTAGASVSSGKMTYYISADGSETNRLQIYKGKNLNNTEFTAVSDLAIGDRVTVFGQLKNFNNTPEMNDGNYLVSKEGPAVATPVFTPNGGGFMGETDVTITCATGSSTIYYTLDGTNPTKLSTLYEGAIHLDATTTITAIAYVGEESSLVVAKEFTLTAPMTVAEALAALDSEDPINNAAVSGIISTAPSSNPSSGKLTYYISDDGSATDQLEVYLGFGLNGAAFSAKTDLQVGDEVTVFGNLTIHNYTTKEFASGSRLLAFNRPTVDVTGVTLDATASVKVGKTVTLTAEVEPANATNKTIVWTIESGSDKVSVDNGIVTGVAEGTAVIRAASDEDASIYAECTVTVNAAVTFDNSGYEWQLVTSADQLIAGKYYVLVSTANNKVAGDISSDVLSTVTAVCADDVIAYNAFGTEQTADAADVVVFELGGTSSAWTLNEVVNDLGLLGYKGNKTVKWGGDATSWTIEIANNNATMVPVDANTYHMLYNVNNPRFTVYTSDPAANMLLPQLYVWTEKVFKLRYDANGGDNAPAATPAVAGKATVTSAQPTKENQIFNGWNENVGGTGASYAAGDEVTVSSTDVTIYAQWRDPNTYTITYDANGGTLIDGKSDIDPEDVTEGNQYTVKANVYEKDGKIFTGWLYGENIYNASDKFYPTEDIEFVAQWSDPNISDFILVTNLNQLQNGDKVYIVAAEYLKAMGTQNGTTYRNEVEIAKTTDKSRVIIATSEPVEFTLGIAEGKYTFSDETGYLYAAGTANSGKNYINTKEEYDAACDWNITIDENGTVITSVSNGYTPYMQFNSGSHRFACYHTESMQAIVLYKKANYVREVTAGRYGTICLPNSGIMNGAALFEIAYYDGTVEKIYFDEILNGEMVAGRPYIFLAEEGVAKFAITYTDAADAPAGNYRGLYGSYTQQVLAQNAGNYILYNNQYMYVGASSTNVSVGANRAYFKIGVEGGIPTNAIAPLPGRRRVSMSAVRETPTGLENGELINGENGVQKVLINGELFILRGEKMYDATGRLVK